MRVLAISLDTDVMTRWNSVLFYCHAMLLQRLATCLVLVYCALLQDFDFSDGFAEVVKIRGASK